MGTLRETIVSFCRGGRFAATEESITPQHGAIQKPRRANAFPAGVWIGRQAGSIAATLRTTFRPSERMLGAFRIAIRLLRTTEPYIVSLLVSPQRANSENST
jgi:hypothetical protein